MVTSRQTVIPSLVRVKSGALDRLGIYADRHGFRKIVLFFSEDLQLSLVDRTGSSFQSAGVEVLEKISISSASFEEAIAIFNRLPKQCDAIVGLGGGKALDVAKYVSFLSGFPYIAVPTSLSNDGICSPQSSLTVEGKRKSLSSCVPMGVVIDTAVCVKAPEILWHSGVGDLSAKFTAVVDWKIAFHAKGTVVDDFAALLSDASVFQFIARPERDMEGMKLLGTALLLNGVAMAICGSSRPASGSEHLISHALDSISSRPRLHGLQVGVATYLISCIQGQHTETIAKLFEVTGFWKAIEKDPFDQSEWLEAIRMAPSIKQEFYTVLSERDCFPELQGVMNADINLKKCFTK